VEGGIWELRRVERRGIRVLNPAPSLIACHDKLRTFRALRAFGVPHVVLEVNGAVDFTDDYSLVGREVFAEVAMVVAGASAELEGQIAELGG
jgi:hypothetical protein